MANKTIPELTASGALAAADEFPVSQGSAAATKGNFTKLGALIGFLSGLATSVINFLTGANIASAATINLDTATGNRVHITGTTTITAVTLTRGPRTLIFDGVLTLTHHATNNNLPGGANITTAAGDRAIYESDGTTVYCVSYIKANGQAVVAGSSFTTPVTTTDTTQSTSTSTGSIVTAGGVGIAKNVYVGGILAMSVGAVGTPSYTFTGDLNTGIYWIGADSFGLATGGTLRLSISTTAVTSTLPIAAPVGSQSAPGYSFSGDPDTGIYSNSADRLDFVTGGARILNMVANGTVNYFRMFANGTGVGPELLSDGSDTNIDIKFTPKGTGVMQFGVASASVATPSTHKIQIKAADGTTYYLLATT